MPKVKDKNLKSSISDSNLLSVFDSNNTPDGICFSKCHNMEEILSNSKKYKQHYMSLLNVLTKITTDSYSSLHPHPLKEPDKQKYAAEISNLPNPTTKIISLDLKLSTVKSFNNRGNYRILGYLSTSRVFKILNFFTEKTH